MDIRKHSFFRKESELLLKRRQDALSRPLAPDEIEVLLSMRWNGKAMYDSREYFYSDDYRKVRESCSRPMKKEEWERLSTFRDKNGDLKYLPSQFKATSDVLPSMSETMACDLLRIKKLEKYRYPTETEVNLIYCDLHSRIVKEGLEMK